MRYTTPALLFTLTLFLAACQHTTAQAPVATAPQPTGSNITPAGFRLPEGGGCANDIARFRAIQANDLETGHVNRKVYDQIAGELNQASSRCSAGNDGAARGSLAGIKRRYGYPG